MHIKPRCTISLDWNGKRSCGEPAISRNDFGGFQCEWHTSLGRCKTNPHGPYTSINCAQHEDNDPERLISIPDIRYLFMDKVRLQAAYILYLLGYRRKFQPKGNAQ